MIGPANENPTLSHYEWVPYLEINNTEKFSKAKKRVYLMKMECNQGIEMIIERNIVHVQIFALLD